MPSVVRAGTPCWIELAARDEDRARAFYTGLFGWRFTVAADPAAPYGRYAIAELDGAQVAGLYTGAPGAAPGWTPHLAVQDITMIAARVPYGGGRVSLGPVEIPGRGTILHAVEPSGAPVVFWRLAPDWQFATDVPGAYTAADLNTHDGLAADRFFRHMFPYAAVQVGDGQDIDYVEWRLGREPVLYRYVMGSEYPASTPAHWMVYFKVDPVDGVETVVERALRGGGSVVLEPYDSQWGRIAVLADPDGAVFSLIDHSEAVGRAGRAEVEDPDDD